MINVDQIDSLFNEDSQKNQRIKKSAVQKHTKWVRRAKLVLPSFAAVLVGMLILFPALQQNEKDIFLDITRPKKGELEKLHVEKTILNITDKENKVHNFTAENIDETSPGSKLIKLTKPDGVMPTSLSDWANIKSPTGYYDQNKNTLRLLDNVEIFYSQGMNISVPDIMFDFNTSVAQSDKPVQAQGDMGDLTSEGFEYNTKTGIMTFRGKTFIKIKENDLKGTD